jgi:hypothetical protein
LRQLQDYVAMMEAKFEEKVGDERVKMEAKFGDE